LVYSFESACEILHSMLAMRSTVQRMGKQVLTLFAGICRTIVITDINMPEMDGIRMLENLSAINPDARVIVITTHSDRLNFERITSTGVAVNWFPNRSTSRPCLHRLSTVLHRCQARSSKPATNVTPSNKTTLRESSVKIRQSRLLSQ
jgi:DNA-binding NarL/FixJ family response regulator